MEQSAARESTDPAIADQPEPVCSKCHARIPYATGCRQYDCPHGLGRVKVMKLRLP
jgi:ribosomal protein L40E